MPTKKAKIFLCVTHKIIVLFSNKKLMILQKNTFWKRQILKFAETKLTNLRLAEWLLCATHVFFFRLSKDIMLRTANMELSFQHKTFCARNAATSNLFGFHHLFPDSKKDRKLTFRSVHFTILNFVNFKHQNIYKQYTCIPSKQEGL